MEQMNSRNPTLDGYFGSQEVVQGMSQLNPMTPNLNDYYHNQHGVQGLGQLNSLAPILEAHYVAQQRMHGMGQLQFRPQTAPGCFAVQDSLQDMASESSLGICTFFYEFFAMFSNPLQEQSNLASTQLHGLEPKHLHSKHPSH